MTPSRLEIAFRSSPDLCYIDSCSPRGSVVSIAFGGFFPSGEFVDFPTCAALILTSRLISIEHIEEPAQVLFNLLIS